MIGSQQMQQVQKKIENIVNKCQKENNFLQVIKSKLGSVFKSLGSQCMSLYEQIVRQITMCLAIDYYQNLSIPQVYKKELNSQKEESIRKIKNAQSVLVIQGKLRDISKIMNLYIAATKIAYEFLTDLQQIISEQYLFQRLNLILNGQSLSAKCYKVAQIKSSHFNQTVACSKVNEHVIESDHQNLEFKKLFFDATKREKNQKEEKLEHKKKDIQRSNSKILKLIKNVEETIKRQSKKFNFLQIKPKQQKSKSKFRYDLMLLQLQQNEKNKRVSLMQECKRKNSIRKRVGRLNSKQNIRSRFVELRNMNKRQRQNKSEISDSDLSMQSVPNCNQIWFQPSNQFRIKKVLTLQLPNVGHEEMKQFF